MQGRHNLLFLAHPFGRFPVPEFFRDFAIQLVQVRLIEPVTQCGQSPLEALALLFPNRFLAAFIREQGFFKLQQHVIWDLDIAERDGQPVAKFLFPEVREIAFAAIAGAMVIGVAVLFEFCRYRTVVISAMEQTGKRKFPLAILRLVAPAKHSLHLLEKFYVYERYMRTAVELVFPDELPFIERILEQPFKIAFCEKLAKFFLDNFPHARKRMLAGGVEFKHPFRNWRFLRVYFNGVFEPIVAVAQWWTTRVDALLGLLAHPLFHFFAQVLDVVARNHDLNAMHELRLRFRILTDDLAFFGQMDFNFQIFQSHAIAKISVQAVCFLDNERAASGILLEKAHHFAKLLPPSGFCRFHVNEFAFEVKSVPLRIIAQKF